MLFLGMVRLTSENVRLTSEALKYFSFGIPAFAVLKIFANLFFARIDTKTPFIFQSL